MEEAYNNQQSANNIAQNSAKKQMNIWMIISIVLIIALIGGGAYLFGKNQIVSPKTYPVQTNITQASASPTLTQELPTNIVTPVPTSMGKRVNAGMKNQFYSAYTVTIPSGWVDIHTTNTASDTLAITKGQYIVTLSQAAGGAGSCDFPGDTPEPMAQVFSSFVGITGTFAQFRRGTADNTTYTICEQKNGGFAFPTSIGYITYAVPSHSDQTMLGEMDAIVASITK